jgi:ABC-type sugar transport system substrate-binding protein
MSTKRLRWTKAAAALGCTSALLLSGCAVDQSGTAAGGSDSTEAAAGDRAWNEGGAVTVPTPAEESGKDVNIMFTGFGQDNNLANAFAEAVVDEAKLYGATAEFAGPPTYDPVAQSTLLCDAATSGRYEAIVMQTIDSASIVECAKQAVAAGIDIVTIEFPIGPDVTADELQLEGIVAQIREDVVGIATAQADAAIKTCKDVDPCKVGIGWGVRSLAFDAAKVDPLISTLSKHDNIEVACQADAGYTEDQGRTVVADCLSANPDLDLLIMGSDESAHGAELAIADAGKSFGLAENDIKIIGAYARKYGVQQIIDGKWVMSTFSRPNADGRAAVDLILAHRGGAEVPENINSQDLDRVGLTIYPETVGEVPNILDLAY